MSSEEAVVPVSMLSERCRGSPSKVLATTNFASELAKGIVRTFRRSAIGRLGGIRRAEESIYRQPNWPKTLMELLVHKSSCAPYTLRPLSVSPHHHR